jgi:hypothetical protein
MSDDYNTTPKLTDKNYHEWVGRSKSYLTRKGVWYVFLELAAAQRLEQAYIRHVKKIMLEKGIVIQDHSNKTLIANARLEQDINEGSDELIQMLDAQDLARVQGQSPAEMWKTLEATHKKRGATNVILKQKQMQQCHYEEITPGAMTKYIANKRKFAKEILAAGGTFSDDQLQASILDGLGEHFETQATVISMQTMTTEQIENTLILAEAKALSVRQDKRSTRTRTHTDEHAPQEPALANMAGGGTGGKRGMRNKPPTFQGKCDECGATGHKRDQCWWIHPHLIRNPAWRKSWEEKIEAKKHKGSRARKNKKKHKYQKKVSESEVSSASDSDSQ